MKNRDGRSRPKAAGASSGKQPGRSAFAGRKDAGAKPGGVKGSPVRAPRPDRAAAREKERDMDKAATKPVPPAEPARSLIARQGELPAERVPVILESSAGEGGEFRLIDSGKGEKLEQYGPYRIVRPEAQALWPRSLPDHVWDRADAIFTGDTDEDGMGRWRFPREALGETWPMRLAGVDFHGRFTAFRHVGVFPEQLVHWNWMREAVEKAGRPVKVLNLFGYTGVASLVAAAAGAEVTHVDASRKAIGWARENQSLAGLDRAPVRWICEDAMKFILREERRGSRYDIILTDPPKFGRGPNGEVWHLFDHLPMMLDICREILSPKALGLVLTA